MPKTKNNVETKKLTISTTPKVMKYLEKLVGKELYGKREAEVAEEMIRQVIRQLIQEGKLKEEE